MEVNLPDSLIKENILLSGDSYMLFKTAEANTIQRENGTENEVKQKMDMILSLGWPHRSGHPEMLG